MNARSKTLVYLLIATMLVLQVVPVSARGDAPSLKVQQKIANEIIISKYQTAQRNPNLSDEEKNKGSN
jgi:hypothetical protein